MIEKRLQRLPRSFRGWWACGLFVWLAAVNPCARAQTIPNPPTSLVATAVSTNQIKLSWMDNSTNEDSFAIERAPDSTGVPGAWAQIATVGANVTNYSDTGLSPGTKCWYRVRAHNAGGDSDYSNQARAGTPALCPRLVIGWGNNGSGQATPPAGLEWVTAIAAGSYHCLALERDGTVVSWGDNSSGQTNTPSGLSNVVAIAAGSRHSLALKTDGTVVSWGDSYYATPPAGLSNVVAIAAGGYFSLALQSDGTVTNWGDPYYGKPPAGLNNVVAIAARDYNPLALKSDGTVVAWSYAPTPPAGLNNVVAIAVGYFHCLALKSDGTVVSWGSGPTPPAGLTNVVAIAAGNSFSLALKRDGTVVGWGFGSAATPPAGLTPAVAIAAGSDHSLALTTPCSLSAPSALRATAVSSTQINLSWLDDSSDEAGFKIERAPDIGGFPGAWTQIATVGANVANYSDTGRLAHTAYWYRVRAYNGGGDSDYSNQATATTPNLESPSGLAATSTSTNQIDLSWKDNSSTEDGFEIERAPDFGGFPGAWTQIATVSTNVAAYRDTGLPANTKYWYRARTYNAADISDYSNQASATTPALCPRLVVGWGDNSSGKATPPAGLEWVVAIAAADTHSLALKTNGTVVGWGSSFYATPPAGLSNVVAISAKYDHSLVLKSDGSVTNWGYGPPPPPAGLSNVIAIAAGYYHDLVLKRDGTVVSWGSGPTPPPGLSNVVAIAAGAYDSLALKSDGTVDPWGGSTKPSGLTNVVAIAAGYSQCLALKSDGTVVSWNGPTPPAGLSNVVAITAGNNFSLALKSDGTIVGWGENWAGQVTPPTGLTRVVAIAAGGSHSLALTTPCSLSAPSAFTATAVSASQINLAWLDNSGDENGFKIERSTDGINFTQIAQVLPNTMSYRNTGLWPGTTYFYRVRPYNSGGDGDSSNVASAGTPAQCLTSIVNWGNGPTLPLDLTNVVAIASSLSFYDLALKSDGTVVRWGGSPTPPPGWSNVVAIAAGSSHALALKSDATVVGWGNPPAATPPAGLSNVVAIAAGYSHSLALKSDGMVVAWGINSTGETNVPAGLSGVVGIAAGSYYSLALKCDGTVVGWGRNDYGQAAPPAFLRAVTAIAAGDNHSLALTSYGTVVGWGNYFYGQTNVPAGLTSVVGIDAGYNHSLALKSNGTVVAWGNNSSSQTDVPAGLNSVVAIAAGAYHNVAMSCASSAPSTLVATTVTKSQINLSWTDNSINENRFGIERAASSIGPWAEIGSVDSDVTTYSDTGLSCGQTYYYRVRAYDATAGSPYSNIANANTSPDDLDCDGITDSWMQQYFGHPYGQTNDNSRATDDTDGDGFVNLAEFQAGTDPTNSASAFRILEIAALDEDMLLTWAAVGGKWYIVQTTTNFTGSLSNSFYDLNPVIIAPGTGEYALSVLHLGAATNAPARFYRVRLVP